MKEMLKTKQLLLSPASAELLRAEITDLSLFGKLLGAKIPASWPPESMKDAYDWFIAEIEKFPANEEWYVWYALLPDSASNGKTLVGSAGFRGAPGNDGRVEIGYSVLPEFQGQNFATEITAALLNFAFANNDVQSVFAETAIDNAPSIRVLVKNGFREYDRNGDAVFYQISRDSFNC
jgi:RimJ/RimL family protein N-acetyltransferase